MRVSKYIHACLLVEDGDDKILFDPERFSFIEGLAGRAGVGVDGRRGRGQGLDEGRAQARRRGGEEEA